MTKTATKKPILFGSEARQFVAPPPLSDSVMVRIPKEYQTHSLEIIIVPIADESLGGRRWPSDFAEHPKWSGDALSFQRNLNDERSEPPAGKVPLFGALKGKIKYIAPDFDEPLEDFAEYM